MILIKIKEAGAKLASLLKKETSTLKGLVTMAYVSVLTAIGLWGLCQLNWRIALVSGLLLLANSVVVPMIVKWLKDKNRAPSPTPEEIGLTAAAWLGRVFNGMLHERLAVFQHLYYERYPVDGPERWFYELRWYWWAWCQNGQTVISVAMQKANAAVLSRDALVAARQTLQGVLTTDVKAGYVPLVAHVSSVGNLPTLCLLDIRDTPEHTYFDFVWVNNETTADFVHRYGVKPGGGGDADDLDF